MNEKSERTGPDNLNVGGGGGLSVSAVQEGKDAGFNEKVA